MFASTRRLTGSRECLRGALEGDDVGRCSSGSRARAT